MTAEAQSLQLLAVALMLHKPSFHIHAAGPEGLLQHLNLRLQCRPIPFLLSQCVGVANWITASDLGDGARWGALRSRPSITAYRF